MIEVDKQDLMDLPDIIEALAGQPFRFILFSDDLSFSADEPGYTSLKAVLDGSVAATPDNVLIYATSNRRHLMPEYMRENLETKYVGDEIHPGESVEEKISLSERFGLWVSFYPFDQDEYLTIVRYWLGQYGVDVTAKRRAAKRCNGRCSAARAAGASPRSSRATGPVGTASVRARLDPCRPLNPTSMTTAATARPVEVAAAVILRPDGRFLLAQRPAGKVYAGYWEFPGGKVEPGEPARAALKRELHEELGIEVTRAYPWITREYVYPHAHVRLNFFRVLGWEGEPHSREGQALQLATRVRDRRCTGASRPTGRSCARSRCRRSLRITDACAARRTARCSSGSMSPCEHGLRMVMVREKQMAPDRRSIFTAEVLRRCRPRRCAGVGQRRRGACARIAVRTACI